MYSTELDIKIQKKKPFKISYTNCTCAHVQNFADALSTFYVQMHPVCGGFLNTMLFIFSTSNKKNFQVSITLTHFFFEYHLPIAFYFDYLTTVITA